jgi:hypothetical protein
MAATRDWQKEVTKLRKSAESFHSLDNDAALMRCRKSMEAIQYSIFEEINGELPTTYLPFEKMMGNKGIGLHIPKPVEIDFKTVHEWGNYGCHYQNDSEPNESQVESALSALDSLIEWRFDDEKPNRKLAASTKPQNKELLIKLPFNVMKKKYKVNNLLKYLTIGETLQPKQKSLTKTHDKSVTDSPKTENVKGIQSKQHNHKIAMIHLLTRAIELSGGSGNNWVRLSSLGINILKINPTFKLKNTGHGRLISLLREHKEVFEIRMDPTKDGKKIAFVRIRKLSDN